MFCCLTSCFTHIRIIEQLQNTLKNQEVIYQRKINSDQETDAASADTVKQLSDLITTKDQELEVWFSYVARDTLYCFALAAIKNIVIFVFCWQAQCDIWKIPMSDLLTLCFSGSEGRATKCKKPNTGPSGWWCRDFLNTASFIVPKNNDPCWQWLLMDIS